MCAQRELSIRFHVTTYCDSGGYIAWGTVDPAPPGTGPLWESEGGLQDLALDLMYGARAIAEYFLEELTLTPSPF